MNIYKFLQTILFLPIIANAQYESTMQSATNIGLSTLQGTARYVGSGGVISTVGGDLSNLSSNPAGLGMFSKTEISFTPVIGVHNTHSNYQFIEGNSTQGTIMNNNQIKFLFNSLGVVIANRKSEENDLRASNIVIGLNRTADFNRTTNFGVENNTVYSYSNYLSDVATYFQNNLGDYPSSSYLPIPRDYKYFDNLRNQTLIARNAELIAYDPSSAAYIDPTPYFDPALNVRQSGQRKTSGGINELSVAWAGNIKDKYYLGVSLGIPIVSYKSELIFSEDNNGAGLSHNVYGKYKYMDLTQTDEYAGVGVNLKLGGLFKLTNQLKASAYIHTPTYYQMTNDYIVGMNASYENRSDYTAKQAIEQIDFAVFTPFKAGLGLSYMFGKFGFLGVEYEYNNLTNLTVDIKDIPDANSYVNATLGNNNQNYHIFKLGSEIVIPDFSTGKQSPFRLRLGYNYRTSPKQKSAIYQLGDLAASTYTAGIGIRGKSVSFDLAYMLMQYRDYDYIYGYDGSQGKFEFGSANWNSLNQFMATINFRLK